MPQAATQALDIALRHTSSMKPSCQVFNRSFFWHDPSRVHSLGGGAEVTASADLYSALHSHEFSEWLDGAAIAGQECVWCSRGLKSHACKRHKYMKAALRCSLLSTTAPPGKPCKDACS